MRLVIETDDGKHRECLLDDVQSALLDEGDRERMAESVLAACARMGPLDDHGGEDTRDAT